MGQIREGALGELLDAIRFAIESKRNRFSLDTYLDIVGEYADRLIIETEENENMQFSGGECTVIPDMPTRSFRFWVKLFFHDSNGKEIVKEAQRSLAMSRFIMATADEIGESKTFEIHRPGKEQ